MISGHPTASFLSGDENTELYRWVMRSTGHIIFADATMYSHNAIISDSGLTWEQIVAAGYYYPYRRQVAAMGDNNTNMNTNELNNYVQEAFDEKVTHESKVIKTAGPYLDPFGFWNGQLYIGNRHHADILARLIDEGATWEQLMADPPVFGWLQHTEPDEEGGEDRPRDVIYVQFNTDTGAPRPGDRQAQEVLDAISKKYKRTALKSPNSESHSYVNMGLWNAGTSYSDGVDSERFNLHYDHSERPEIYNPYGFEGGEQVKINDPDHSGHGQTGYIDQIDRDDEELPFKVHYHDQNDYDWFHGGQLEPYNPNKESSWVEARNGWSKWLYDPETNDYQEWNGDTPHYNIATMIWPGKKDWRNWWGGSRTSNNFEVAYHPYDGEMSTAQAKNYLPNGLLKHLINQQQN